MATSKIGKAFAKEPVEPVEGEDPEMDSAGAEVAAMKAFSKASSPEAKADALKDFLRACGALGYEEEPAGDMGLGPGSELPF